MNKIKNILKIFIVVVVLIASIKLTAMEKEKDSWGEPTSSRNEFYAPRPEITVHKRVISSSLQHGTTADQYYIPYPEHIICASLATNGSYCGQNRPKSSTLAFLSDSEAEALFFSLRNDYNAQNLNSYKADSIKFK